MAAEDPSVSGVSGRYATALFELAREEKSVDAVKAELDRFDAMLTDSPDLRRLVRSPVFSADAQSKALTAVLEKAEIGGIAANFLKVLTANRRLFAVADVIRAFRALVAKFKGEATADVTVAEAAQRQESRRPQERAEISDGQGRSTQRESRSLHHRRACGQARQPHGG